MQFDSIAPQKFDRTVAGGRFESGAVISPTPQKVEWAARRLGLRVKVTANQDGSLQFSANDLALDTELETAQHGIITVREALKLMERHPREKIRCQTPFRNSESYAAFMNVGPNGKPFIYDSGTGTTHWLSDVDWRVIQRNSDSAVSDSTPLFCVDDYRAGRFIDKIPPPRRWLFKEIIPFGKVGIIVAPGGTGKSQFLLQLGASVATGRPHAGAWEVSESGSVLMMLAEDDEEELHLRLDNIIRELALVGDPEMLDALRTNLIVKSMVGDNNLMTETNQSREVQQTIYVGRLIATAAQIPNLKLIVIDPASRFRGGDENAAQDTTRFVEAIERVAQATGATVLIAHHTNKGSMQALEATQNAARGSSALTDGVRWQLNLATMSSAEAKEYDISEDDRRFHLAATITKNNYAPPQPKFILKRGEGGYLKCVELTPQRVQKAQDLNSKVVELVTREFKAGAHYSKTAFEAKYGGIDGQLGSGKNAVREALTNLLLSNKLRLDSKKKLAPPQRATLKTYPSNLDTPMR